MHRQRLFPLLTAILLAGCVTINVYFPAAAAQRAADAVIDNIMGSGTAPPASSVPATSAPPASAAAAGADDGAAPTLALRLVDLLVPAASAAEPVNLDIQTPAITAIEARMGARFRTTLESLLQAGAVGYTHAGDVAIRDAASIPLAERARMQQAVAAENADRAELYRQIALANGHPEWTQSLRETFAQRWIHRAQRAGYYYQDAAGNWHR